MGSRVLFLVRHGQYVTDEKHVRFGQLTSLGRRQAQRTGRRFAGFDGELAPQAIYHSDMPRAVETAQIIAAGLDALPMHSMVALRETLPPFPKRRGQKPRPRMELAQLRAVTATLTKKFLHAPSGNRRRVELIVAHGNLIRYLVRLALRDTPTDWWKMGTSNCGVTLIFVREKESNYLIQYNDVGHLPAAMQTMM